MTAAKLIFFICLILAASGYVSPPIALLGGLIYGFTFTHPYQIHARKFSRYLLQASVVGLGFGMNLHEIVHAGRAGFIYTAIGITSSMLLGTLLGMMFRVGGKVSYLITVGTAICGGSAIAAVAPITNAGDEDIAVSLGTVFVLNSIALFIFPMIGGALHLSQSQFGLWAALAIHDTSSVVGATAKYGAEALAIGTTVKLARALWIVPIALITAAVVKSKTKIQWPWFILFFCLAAVANTYLPSLGPAYPVLYKLGRIGLTVTLFLIGTGLSKATIKQVGARPLLQGVILWAIVAVSTLMAIRSGWIGL
ncbi:MAG TPA: putative sulfate exporter family transporter [Candidatus Acidoferrales bacterium]